MRAEIKNRWNLIGASKGKDYIVNRRLEGRLPSLQFDPSVIPGSPVQTVGDLKFRHFE